MPDVSIVIPAKNEVENIGALIDDISKVCTPICAHEIIVVDDAATDGMADVVRARMRTVSGLRLLTHQYSAGQSAAVETGVRAALSEIVATLDGDGQNPPEDLPKLFVPLLEGGTGLMAGQRVGRKDTWSKRMASKIANRIRSAALRDGTRDTGCGLKAFRREDYLRLPYFDHMHRFLPALFAREGLRVTHIDVGHRHRGGGRSHYSNVQRAAVGIVDLIGVMWLIRRRRHGTLVQPVTDPHSDLYQTRES